MSSTPEISGFRGLGSFWKLSLFNSNTSTVLSELQALLIQGGPSTQMVRLTDSRCSTFSQVMLFWNWAGGQKCGTSQIRVNPTQQSNQINHFGVSKSPFPSSGWTWTSNMDGPSTKMTNAAGPQGPSACKLRPCTRARELRRELSHMERPQVSVIF